MSFRIFAHRAPDEVVPAAPVTPPPAAPVAAAPVVPVVPAVAPAAPEVVDPDWLNKRLAQAKTSAEKTAREALLKELGVADPAAAKAAIAAAKAAEDAKKTAEERAAAEIAALKPAAAKANDYLAALTERATFELSTLTDAQKTMVTSLVGDDPVAQLKAITTLKAGGAFAPAPAAPAANTTVASTTPVTPPAAAPAARPAPASTTAAGGAPAPASTSSVDHEAVYESLKKVNPIAAAQYAMRYEAEIYKEAP